MALVSMQQCRDIFNQGLFQLQLSLPYCSNKLGNYDRNYTIFLFTRITYDIQGYHFSHFHKIIPQTNVA